MTEPELSPIIEGREDGATLFFIQGWPDDASVWDAQVAALRDRYRCVRVNMPNYEGKRVRRGHTTDEIVEALARCVRQVSPNAPVTLVIHDWGAYWGYLLHGRHPELAWRIAGLDVAPHIEPSAAGMLGIIAYQGWLWGAFTLGGPVGDWMTREMATRFRAPLPRQKINAWMNYPYRNFWRDRAAGRVAAESDDYWPAIPLLFVYGKRKPFEFHSRAWIEHVERHGKAVGLDCGHWVQHHPDFTPLLVEWLAETDRDPDAA